MEEAYQFLARNTSEPYRAFWKLWGGCWNNASKTSKVKTRKFYRKYNLCFAKSYGLVDDNRMLQRQRIEHLIKGSCIFNSEQERNYYLNQTRTVHEKWNKGFASHCNEDIDKKKMDYIGILGAMRSEGMRSEDMKEKLRKFMTGKKFKGLYPRFTMCGLPRLRNCLWIPNTPPIVGKSASCQSPPDPSHRPI